jgi:hypothetical protein
MTRKELPDGFVYPKEFLRVVELGLTRLEPWWIFEGELLRARHKDLAKRYPTRSLVPFARRQDNDDVVCWEVGRADEVVIVHDVAPPGWARRGDFPNFYDWFRQAVEDFIAFDER